MLDKANSTNDHLYIKILICELLILMQSTEKDPSPIYENDNLPRIISDTLAYITSNYSTDITLQSISEYFYANPSYLSRLFKQQTGFTFCNYLNKFRITDANKLLAETDKKITVIAFECGFNSSNNFCKCYKRIMKISPLSYRKYMKH